jgi:predicted ester cyclase
MASDDNKIALLRAIEHFNHPPSRERYFDLYAPHAVLHRSPSLPPGLENIKQFYRAYWLAFPDIQLRVKALLGEADLVACSFEAEATHQGMFLDIPATGRSIRYTGVTILRFEQGYCVERWSQMDVLAILRQLGVYPGIK